MLFTTQYNRSEHDNVANENGFTRYWAYVPPTTPQTQLFTDPTFIAPPLRFEPPVAFVPDGAGLGVSLDSAALDRYAIQRQIIGDFRTNERSAT